MHCGEREGVSGDDEPHRAAKSRTEPHRTTQSRTEPHRAVQSCTERTYIGLGIALIVLYYIVLHYMAVDTI